jgi:hypothetical protein
MNNKTKVIKFESKKIGIKEVETLYNKNYKYIEVVYPISYYLSTVWEFGADIALDIMQHTFTKHAYNKLEWCEVIPYQITKKGKIIFKICVEIIF